MRGSHPGPRKPILPKGPRVARGSLPPPVKRERYLMIAVDYTGLPRAWGIARTRQLALEALRKQLTSYCKMQQERGETVLGDPTKYTIKTMGKM